MIDKPLAIGGAERLAVDLTIALDPDRFDRYFVSTRQSSHRQLDGELTSAGVEYLSLGRRSRLDVAAWRSFARFLRAQRIDVVHTHLFGSNVWGSTVGRLAGVPAIVAHEHTWSYQGRPLRKLADRHIIARLADTIIAVSEADAGKMTAVEHIPRAAITVIPNGIRDPRVTRDRAQIRKELGLSDEHFLVAAVAVIRPQKRLDRLIEAAALLRDEFPLIRVLIVGAGYPDEAVKLESLVEKRGLGEIVRFLGERSDAADVMAASDIGVITSDYEGIPLSLLEFMALRRPVVATAVGGIPEVLEGRHAGILVETLTPEAVAAAVKEIAQLSPAEREAMGDRGRLLQQQRFSFAAYLRSVEELYERLVPDRISGDRRA
ncbi:MAG: hypothetical protein QOJ34_975 [Pseudonocardiales bacterium]|nr:hypothetical protein [Pseudonocardiales bacterium]